MPREYDSPVKAALAGIEQILQKADVWDKTNESFLDILREKPPQESVCWAIRDMLEYSFKQRNAKVLNAVTKATELYDPPVV